MSRLTQLTGGVALAVACAGAAARMHQICFEGPPQPQGAGHVSTAIFGCAIDGTGTCTIAGNGLTPRSPYPLSLGVQSAGNFAYFEGPGTTPMTATITFVDNGTTVTRSCTVNPRGTTSYGNPTPWSPGAGHATPGAVLTGFSTDSSGLATTGVWKLQAATDSRFNDLRVYVPADFISVGGGAMGTDSPTGALIRKSYRELDLFPNQTRNWSAQTVEAGGAAQPHRGAVFVIGLRIEGLTPQALNQLIATAYADSYAADPVAHPANQILAPSGSVVIGGGFFAFDYNGPSSGQFGTATAPLGDERLQCDFRGRNGSFECHFVMLNATGWRSESKDHVIAAPGYLMTQVMALPPTISVGGHTFNVQARLVSATSGIAAHPAADVSGLRGEFALTGIGAMVNWRRHDLYGNQTAAGNLLWKLEPRADLGGASVASKDHIIGSPASITGYALGIKLVP